MRGLLHRLGKVDHDTIMLDIATLILSKMMPRLKTVEREFAISFINIYIYIYIRAQNKQHSK